ncbi:MAG TPA: hypothetical protein VGQ29_15245 [Gemmatimonadales bacterium]|jgi:hypothetical protein|nr:hypothetical protein [Gemmatimonadales bacterium]
MVTAVLGLISATLSTAVQRPTPAITPSQATYRSTVIYQGQSQDAGSRSITVTAVNVDKDAAWRVVSVWRYQDFVSADTVDMRRADLHPLSRHAKIGDGELMLAIVGDTAHGLLTMGNQLIPLNVPLGKAAFLNYHALRAALAGWPVDSSWRIEASVLELNVDPQFIPLRLAVDGAEHITVPAGEYDCWIVRVHGSVGRLQVDERYWVTKRDRIVVRTEEQFGNQGAQLRLELAQFDRQ